MFDKLKNLFKKENNEKENFLKDYKGEAKINVADAETQNFLNKKIKNEKGDKMTERFGWYEKNGVKMYGRIPDEIDEIGNTKIEEIGAGANKKTIEIKDANDTNNSNATNTNTSSVSSNWWDNWKNNFYDPTKRPTKTEENTTLNVVFFKQSILNNIMNKCLPKAGGSEFQFHYRALQIKIINPETKARIVFTIPTIFFNFDQEVSGATVDFDLRKVTEISNQLKPLSQQMAKVFIKQLNNIIQNFKSKGFEIKFIEEEVGSIHRHPGRFGFSSTDLDDNPKSPGVIYRNKKAVDLVQTDSVLYCGTDAELYTTETRIFNIHPVDEADEDKGVEGTVATSPTLCYILQDQENSNIDDIFASFFNEPVQENELKWLIHSYKDAKEYKEIKKMFGKFIKNYTPADAVNPELIKQKTYAYSYGYYDNSRSYYYGNSYKGSTKKSINDAKEEISMELKFFEPVNHQDVEFAKEYLKDPETVATLKDIYDYYKNKKDKLVVNYKGGVQVIMNTKGGRLMFKGKEVWRWDWSTAADDFTYEDLYGGI